MSDNEDQNEQLPPLSPKKKEKKPRKPLTQAQKDALAKGREKRDKNREKVKTKKEANKRMKIVSKSEDTDSSEEDEYVIKPRNKKKEKQQNGGLEGNILQHLLTEMMDMKKIVNKKQKPITQTVVQMPLPHVAPSKQVDSKVDDSQERMLRNYLKF
jgi:hypothetical protein